MKDISYSQLYELYIVNKKPMWKIAKELNVATGTVFNYLKKYNIKTRRTGEYLKGRKLSPEHIEALRRRMKGFKHSADSKERMSMAKKMHGPGHKKKRADGYIAIYYPDHPNSNKDGYVMEHILIVEKLIGRHLEKNECVHHINAIRDDNRTENLKLMTKSEHMSYHSKKRWETRKGK